MKRKKIKKALIFGITGQDGSYLAELLLEKKKALALIQKELIIFFTKKNLNYIMGMLLIV